MSDINMQIVSVDVLGSMMQVHLFHPIANQHGKSPGIVLAQHIPVGHTGIENDTFTLRSAQRLAEAGFVVAVPFIFHWWNKLADIKIKRDASRDDWTVADMTAAFDLLVSREEVDAQRIGVVGHCWGGRVAWLAACHLPALKACAIFYGGRVKLPMGGGVAPIELAANITCPVIGFFGNDDVNPTPEDVNDYAAALSASGIHYEFHRYDGVGHAFQNFPTPERYREQASEDAWAKLLVFLHTTLA